MISYRLVFSLLFPALLLSEAVVPVPLIAPPTTNWTDIGTTIYNRMYIKTPFSLTFQDKVYSDIYVNEYGQISFGYEIEDHDHPELTIAPKILFNGSADNFNSSVRILNTSNSFSLSFHQVADSNNDDSNNDDDHNDHDSYSDSHDSQRRRTRRLQQTSPLSYTVSFSNTSYQNMSIDFGGSSGSVQVCTSFRCPVAVSVPTGSASAILDCGSNKCYNSNTGSCSTTSYPQCSECSSTRCLVCRKQYKIDDNTGQCTDCSENYTMVNGLCLEKVPRCQTPSATDPRECAQCLTGFLGIYCNISTASRYRGDTQIVNTKAIGIASGITAAILTITVIILVCCFSEKCRRFCCHSSRVSADDMPRVPDRDSQVADKDLNTRYEHKEDESCTICLSAQCDCRTRCGHAFHKSCLQTWMQKADNCPLCNMKPLTLLKACLKCKIFRIPMNNAEVVCKRCLDEQTTEQNTHHYIT